MTVLQGCVYSPCKQTFWICAAARVHKVADMFSCLRLWRKQTQVTKAQDNEYCTYQSSFGNVWLSFTGSLNFDR